MKFELEKLPRTILVEVFSYFDVEDLLEGRFLNKYFFNIIRSNIYHYLSYSAYDNIGSFKEVQEDFIKRFNSRVRHLNMYDSALFDYALINASLKDHFFEEDSLLSKFEGRFTNLTSLNIIMYEEVTNYINKLNHFKELINKVSKFYLNSYQNINLESTITLFNSEKLKVLGIHQHNDTALNMNSILKFNQFKFLEYLELEASEFEINSNSLPNPEEIIFPSLKILKVHRTKPNSRYVNIKMFGYIEHLEKVSLNLKDLCSGTLEYFKKRRKPKLVLEYVPNSMENEFYSLTQELLLPVSEISTNTSIVIRAIYNVYGEVGEELPFFVNVDKITFICCNLSLQYIFYILKYFPNVKHVNFQRGWIEDYMNLPLLLPNNLETFLFSIDTWSLLHVEDSTLHLLDGINTYIYPIEF